MQKLVIATKNAGKLREMREMLSHLSVEVVSLADFSELPDAVEDASTFAGNARIKAQFYADAVGFPFLADDSGIEVAALAGAPGVHSARYAGEHGNDAANNEKMVRELKKLGMAESPADYRCAMVFAIPGVKHAKALTEGRVDGRVVLTPRGEGGFGYDPYFIPKDYPEKHMAELTQAEKEAISHRGRALRRMLEKLEAYYAGRNHQ